MKTQIFFTGGEWDGRVESLEVKTTETISTLDVPCKDGMYARYRCDGHEKAPRRVEVRYVGAMSHEDLTRTQKEPAFDIMATVPVPNPKAPEWKLLSQEKPNVGDMVMVAHLDPKGLPYNLTIACMDQGGHFRPTPGSERTLGWMPSAWRPRFV